MRLLLFVFLTWNCVAALKANYSPAQTEVIGKLEEDTKGLDGKIDNLIKSLNDRKDKNVKPAQGEKELDKKQIAEVEKVIEELAKFKNGTIPAKFNVNAINDLFPNNNTTNVFIAVEGLLENAGKAVKFCVKAQQCTYPLAKLSGENGVDIAKNVNSFKTAEKAYSNRDTEKNVRQMLPSLLMKFPGELSYLHSYIDYQLAKFPEEAKRILSGIPQNISLPDLVDVFNGTKQHAGVNETLSTMTAILQNAGRALYECQHIPTGTGEVPCSMGDKIPLSFTLDPSNIEAFKNIVKEYNKRPASDAEPTPIDPNHSPTNSTNAPDVDSSSDPTTTPSSDNNGGKPKPEEPKTPGKCCQLCLLPAMPPNHNNCQSGNQCNCGCSCNSGNTRGCRTQSKCCSSNNHCKDNCCEKGHHEDKQPVVHTEVINVPPTEKATSSSSSMAVFISAVSLIATLMR